MSKEIKEWLADTKRFIEEHADEIEMQDYYKMWLSYDKTKKIYDYIISLQKSKGDE